MPKKAITTPKAKAIGPYSAAVESGDLVFVSGQTPLDSATGKLVEGDIAAQAKQSLENLKTVLGAAGLTFAHVVKTTIFLTSMGDFAAVNEVYKSAEQRLGKTLVTIQTGPAGRAVKRLFVEDGCDIGRELYLSALVDRATSRISFIVSTEGGMDIEKVAHDTPDRIATLSIDPASGYSGFHGRKIA